MIDAQSLALCGIPVFPCNALKRPAVEGGFTAANLTPANPWTYPLIGVPIPADIVIIDLDTQKGISTHLVDQALGVTLSWGHAKLQDTPSGGAHYAFKLPKGTDVRQSTNLFKDEIGEGFDTRVHGKGYICTGDTYGQHELGVLKLGTDDILPSLPDQAIAKLTAPSPPAPESQQLPTGDKDAQEVVKMLSHIDADCDYSEWRNVAMALKHYFHDDQGIARTIFDQWSSKGQTKYDPQASDRLWSSIDSTAKQGQSSITLGTVVTMARKNGYVSPPLLDAGEIFATRTSSDSFTDLITKINSDAGQPGAVEKLTSEIKTLGLSPMQRSEAIAVLSRVLKDHSLRIPDKELRDACTPSAAANAPDKLPVPDTVNFIDLPIYQIDALSSNSGQSAGIIYDAMLDGRMGKYGSPYWWTGQQWQPVGESDMTDMVSNAYGRGEFAKRSNIAATAKTLASNLPRLSQLGEPDCRLFFRNGVLDPITGVMAPHDKSNGNISVMTIDYDPSATCPTWDNFIAEIFEDEPERADLLHEQLGWLLCSHTLGIEKSVLFHGSSRAGKGAIIEVLYSIMGTGVIPVKMSQLAKDKSLSSMRNALVAVDSDATTPRGPDAAVVHANFNAITANESVSIPLLFTQEPWHGPLNCKLLVACNEIPVIHDDSGAAPKRWLPLLFNKSFMDREDKTLKSRLIAERQGIAVKMVEGLRRLLINNTFTMPQSTIDQMTALRHASSPVVEFISDCLTVDPDGRVHVSTLYDAYRLWAVRTGNNALSRNRFARSMKTATQSLGVKYVKSLRVDGCDSVNTGFEGITLNNPNIAANNVATLLTGPS